MNYREKQDLFRALHDLEVIICRLPYPEYEDVMRRGRLDRNYVLSKEPASVPVPERRGEFSGNI